MKSQYFCAYHAKQLCGSETQAFSQWGEVMRRGVKAYVQCRIEAATLFLNAAFDIAQLRSECSTNSVFSLMHLCKPVEFLIQLTIAENSFKKATGFLDRLAALDLQHLSDDGARVNTFLGEQYKLIEIAEKDSMAANDAQPPNRLLGVLTPPLIEEGMSRVALMH